MSTGTRWAFDAVDKILKAATPPTASSPKCTCFLCLQMAEKEQQIASIDREMQDEIGRINREAAPRTLPIFEPPRWYTDAIIKPVPTLEERVTELEAMVAGLLLASLEDATLREEVLDMQQAMAECGESMLFAAGEKFGG